MKKGVYRHLKTDNAYIVVQKAINATNQNDGQEMVVYRQHDDFSKYFVREINEFQEKFEFVSRVENYCVECDGILIRPHQIDWQLCNDCFHY